MTGGGAGCPLFRTRSWYFLDLMNAWYVFSLLKRFLVSGSSHTFCTADKEALLLSCSLRLSNHSFVTGGRPAIFRFKLYLQLKSYEAQGSCSLTALQGSIAAIPGYFAVICSSIPPVSNFWACARRAVLTRDRETP